MSPALQADSLPLSHQGSPVDTLLEEVHSIWMAEVSSTLY